MKRSFDQWDIFLDGTFEDHTADIFWDWKEEREQLIKLIKRMEGKKYLTRNYYKKGNN